MNKIYLKIRRIQTSSIGAWITTWLIFIIAIPVPILMSISCLTAWTPFSCSIQLFIFLFSSVLIFGPVAFVYYIFCGNFAKKHKNKKFKTMSTIYIVSLGVMAVANILALLIKCYLYAVR